MHYLTALRSGVSVEDLPREFAQALVTASDTEGELCLEFTCHFVNDTLLAIGQSCRLTPQHILDGEYGSLWNQEQINQYIFHCNELEFKSVEHFLVNMCRAIAFIKEDCYPDIITPSDQECGTRDFETPVEYFMEMIAVWCVVYRNLLSAGNFGPSNMFEEPLARINLQLFVGTHDLRMAFRQYFPLLNRICSRLFVNALQGLRFPKTHTRTLNTLLKIVSCDYDSFPEDTGLYIQETLMIVSDYNSYAIVLKELSKMLQENSTQRLNILTNILLKPDILGFFYHILVSKTEKNIAKKQEEVLKFLYVFQSKLLAFDCFDRKFMEAILNLIPQNRFTSSIACQLYIAIMKQKLSDGGTLAHLLDFYVSYVGRSSQLSCYVSQFFKHFEYMRNVYLYLDIVLWPESSEALKLLCAHIVIEIFKIKFSENGSTNLVQDEVESLILVLPQILEKVTCQRTIGILLQLLEFASFEELQKQTLDNIVHYAIGVLRNLYNNYEYPILMNIFLILNKCLNVVHEWHLIEVLGNFLMDEYTKSFQKLQHLKSKETQKEIVSVWKQLGDILKRINIIVKINYDIFEDLQGLACSMDKLLLIKNNKSLIREDTLNQTSNFIDVYALEIATSCIIKLLKKEDGVSISNCFAFEKSGVILGHLENVLNNGELFLKLSEFRMKAYFCSVLNIYCHLPYKLSNNIYYRMTHILIGIVLDSEIRNAKRKNVEEPQHFHRQQKMEYVRLMFRHFTEMHKFDHLELTSNVVWKLCLYFGMPECKFNNELKDLIVTLGNYRFKTYKHIIAVLVYNIYKQVPPLSSSTINLLIRKHKDLIDKDLTADSLHLLKLHIVLLVLQMVKKSLEVRSINERSNRLESLKHLHIFLEDCCDTAAKQNLMSQLDNFKIHLLTAGERKLLNGFITKIQNF